MHQKLIDLVNQIPLEDRKTFRKYVVTGEAPTDFKTRFDNSPLYKKVALDVLVEIYRPFSEAIKKADEAFAKADQERQSQKKQGWLTKFTSTVKRLSRQLLHTQPPVETQDGCKNP